MAKSNLRLQETEPVEEARAQAWEPHIDMHDVLERMVADELRSGRLTPAGRRRVVRYAAGMGLSAVQAGRLLERIRQEALLDNDPRVRRHALRLVPPLKPGMSMRRRLAIGMIATIVLQLLWARLFF